MSFIKTIGDAIWKQLEPLFLQKANELLTDVKNMLAESLREHLPVMLDAAFKAGADTGAKIVKDGADKITDLIPGTLDDQILDPIVGNFVDEFRKRFGL